MPPVPVCPDKSSLFASIMRHQKLAASCTEPLGWQGSLELSVLGHRSWPRRIITEKTSLSLRGLGFLKKDIPNDVFGYNA